LTPAASRDSFLAAAVPDDPDTLGAGVAHRLAYRRGESRYVADDGLAHRR
jgi:hypothetical protein